MSNSNLEEIGLVYSSKEFKRKALRIHGRIGWKVTIGAAAVGDRALPEGVLTTDVTPIVEEAIFFKPNGKEGEWLPVETYRRLKAEKRQRNVEYYQAHPDELRVKVHGKRFGRRAAGSYGC